MKSNTFNISLLAIGVAAAMGVTTANAGTTSGDTSNGAAPITNVATASYSVGTIAQPTVTSNSVTVNVSETANFTLVAINGAIAGDDKNENITTTPGAVATFNHILINEGNVNDTYTVNTTINNDPTIDTATPTQGYTHPENASVAFIIRQKGGGALTTAQASALAALGQAQNGNLTGGVNATTRNIKLPPGLEAALSYTSTTPANRTGGDIAVGTLTATSTFITAATSTGTKVPTLVNENQTIVRLPTFKIAKTATSNVDLSVANPQIAYSITVTNVNTTYSAIADNFVIRDILPTGLSLPNSAASDVTVTGGAGTATISTIGGLRAIDIAVASLPVGESRTITFTVNVDKSKYTAAGSSVTNNVAVYDKFTGTVGVLPSAPVVGTDYDILDSTDNGSDVTRVPAAADQTGGTGVDTTGVTNFSNRSLTLATATTREIAPTTSTTTGNTTGQVTHVATITNLGQDIEGDTNNPLTLTITDGTNAAVDPVLDQFFLIYTPPNTDGTPGSTAGQPIAVTPTKSGNVYTISSSQFPGGIPKGGKLEVRYNMSSTAAVVGSTENTVLKLTAAGNVAPTIAPITDITNVKGLTLLKQAALQVGCSGTIGAYEGTLGNATTITGTAKPGDCIYYKITANNTFTAISGTSISNVSLSDLTNQWKSRSTYQNGSATGGTGTGTVTIANVNDASTEAVTTSLGTLAPAGSGSMTFSIKVNP